LHIFEVLRNSSWTLPRATESSHIEHLVHRIRNRPAITKVGLIEGEGSAASWRVLAIEVGDCGTTTFALQNILEVLTIDSCVATTLDSA
jgi:hypothetical protein